MEPIEAIRLATKIGMVLIALLLLYYLWAYIVFFLALVGAFFIWQEWDRANRRGGGLK